MEICQYIDYLVNNMNKPIEIKNIIDINHDVIRYYIIGRVYDEYINGSSTHWHYTDDFVKNISDLYITINKYEDNDFFDFITTLKGFENLNELNLLWERYKELLWDNRCSECDFYNR